MTSIVTTTALVTRSPVSWLLNIVSYTSGIIQFLLGMRFFLRLAGANASNGLVAMLYGFADIFLSPFRSIFPQSVVEGSVMEWSTLFAMAIYGILTYGLMQLILLLSPDKEIVHTSKEIVPDDELDDL